MRMRPALRWLLPILLGALAYAPAPTAEFVWDDEAVVNFQLEHISGAAQAFRPPPGITRWAYEYYRPLVTLSYLFDATLYGWGRPAGPHLTNVAMHLLTTLLLAALLARLLGGAPGANAGTIAGAALFAVHPIHTESVSWMAGRSDVLATGLLLAALLAALAWRERRSPAALAAAPVAFLLALLAKEQAITGLVLLPLLLGLAPAAGPGARPAPSFGAGARTLAMALLWAAAAGAYFWLRAFGGTPAGLLRPFAAGERLDELVRAIGYYSLKLLWPWPQNSLVTWAMTPGLVPAGAITLGLAALTAAALWRSARTGRTTLALALGWFWCTVSVPVWIATAGVTTTPLAERYLYLPSVAVALGAGALLARACPTRWRAPALTGTAVVLVAFTAATFQRGLVWRDDIALWTDATASPHAGGLAWTNLGLNLMDRDEAAALKALERARADRELDPRWRSRVENGLGIIRLRRGEEQRALEHFRAAAAAMPEFQEAQYGLAAVFAQRAARAAAGHDVDARNAAAEQAIGFYVAALSRDVLYHPVRLKFADFLRQYGDWLLAEGAGAAAARRYRAALRQLEELERRLPRSRRDDLLARIAREAGVDPHALRNTVTAALAGVGASSSR